MRIVGGSGKASDGGNFLPASSLIAGIMVCENLRDLRETSRSPRKLIRSKYPKLKLFFVRF